MKPKSSIARRVRGCVVAVACAFAISLGTANTAEAKPRVGLGGGVGDPFGPSLKIFVAPQHALQFDFGWAPMHLFSPGIATFNYFFHFKPFVSNSVMDFGLYLGIGAGVAFWSRYRAYYGYGYPGYYDGPYRNCRHDPDPRFDDCRYGRGGAALVIRPPVGLFFHWMKVPLDTVIEGGWSPYIVYWYPFQGDVSVKVRYYF